MTIHRLLYRSVCDIKGEAAECEAAVARIVESSRIANERTDLTGALLVASGMFTHVLEGPLAPLEATFERICMDRRHKHIQLIEFTSTESRSFAEWPMASITPSGDLAGPAVTLDLLNGSRGELTCTATAVHLLRSMALAGPRPSGAFAGPIGSMPPARAAERS